jgi:hypothetical protein
MFRGPKRVDPPGPFDTRAAVLAWMRHHHGPHATTDDETLIYRDGVEAHWDFQGNLVLKHPATEADALAGTLYYAELLVGQAEKARERAEADVVEDANRRAAAGRSLPPAVEVRDKLVALDREVDLAKHRFRAARLKYQRAKNPTPTWAYPSRAVLQADAERKQALAGDARRLAAMVDERKRLREQGQASATANGDGHAAAGDDRPRVRVGPVLEPPNPRTSGG